jgi:hypothetical protein
MIYSLLTTLFRNRRILSFVRIQNTELNERERKREREKEREREREKEKERDKRTDDVDCKFDNLWYMKWN